ncbi:flagellar hook-length control protein FliK [Jannaschia seohaensis]|nr:flagellar hook-length control protein FliK [Jannaschia seohaensis]
MTDVARRVSRVTAAAAVDDARRDGDVSGLLRASEAAGALPPRADAPVHQSALPAALDQRVRAMLEQISTSSARDEGGRGAGLRTEIELAPAELGRVRIVLRDTAQGLHLQIAADRPETMDLVRRHVDGLQRAITSEGATLAGLDLSGGENARDRSASGPTVPDGSRESDSDGPTNTQSPPTPLPVRSTDGRLDIRL